MSFQEEKEDNKLVYPKKLGFFICLLVSQNFFLGFAGWWRIACLNSSFVLNRPSPLAALF